MQTFLQDLRYGIRVLAKNPGFTSVAVLTLALGIGANTAIFSVIYHTLLRPLPFPDSEQLVTAWESDPQAGYDQNAVSPGLPPAHRNFLSWMPRAEAALLSRPL